MSRCSPFGENGGEGHFSMRLRICVAAWLIAACAAPTERLSAQRATPSETADNPGLGGLRGDERRVVEYLLDDWGKDSAATTVDIAMDALKVRPNDELRF